MATNTNLKEALTFAARTSNLLSPGGQTVGNASLTRLADALKGTYAYPGGGAWPAGRPDANDAASWFYHHAEALVKNYERRVSEQAVAPPENFQN